MGLRNTNEVLLKDFQQKFKAVFNVEPRIVEGRSVIQNKAIYQFLTTDFSYYSYEWSFPQLSTENTKAWLRAFFDCEGWVENQPAKSRLISLECCNEQGILQVKDALDTLGISSQLAKKKGRTIWRLTICGKENMRQFQSSIDFLHPEKKQKLKEAIASYANYEWKIPTAKEELLAFLMQKGKICKMRNELRVLSILEQNLKNLQKALKEHGIPSALLGPWKSSTCSQYYCLKLKVETIYGRSINSPAKWSSV
ncbi:hypothetical protein HYU22_05260 [Candidatus Woesearchaeota archaeon]|nr:hypothetical protein [Candidatus Woesearchaeota archaeon]